MATPVFSLLEPAVVGTALAICGETQRETEREREKEREREREREREC